MLLDLTVVAALLVWGYVVQGILAAAKLLGLIVLFYVGTTIVFSIVGGLIWKICRLSGIVDEPAQRSAVFERCRPLVAILLALLVYVLVPSLGLDQVFRIILVLWLVYIAFSLRRSRKLLGLHNIETAFVGEIAIYAVALGYLIT